MVNSQQGHLDKSKTFDYNVLLKPCVHDSMKSRTYILGLQHEIK